MGQSPRDNEREFRRQLACKVSGSCAGMWLLVAEWQRLGVWELLKGWSGAGDWDLAPRVAMQLISETAMCTGRVRRKNSLCHQGFHLANGLAQVVSDEQVHHLLDAHPSEQARQLLIQLGYQRRLSGHYPGEIVAIDPHRILSRSQRVMACKKKVPNAPSQKMLQTFFSLCAETGQPIMATMGSTGVPTTRATEQLLGATETVLKKNVLVVADKEHYTQQVLAYGRQSPLLDLLVPVLATSRIQAMLSSLAYSPVKAGVAIAETPFCFSGASACYRLLGQRTGESPKQYSYQGFVTTSQQSARWLLGQAYDQRWSIEKFFRFEAQMGLSRAGTQNLNIRYGKLAMAMIAQAGMYQLRTKLKAPYRSWNAEHLAREVLAWADGDIRVKGDTIIVTFYQAPKHINPTDFIKYPKILEAEGVDPRIPWLYNFKLDFRFK